MGLLIVAAPSLVRAHGMEFLLARLDLAAGRVRIELTADCEGNLMLPDPAVAREAMERLFRVRPQGTAEKGWQELAPLRFEQRARFDPEAPLPPDPTWDGRPHQLLTAVWEWLPPEGTAFQLSLAKGEPLDALLWRSRSDATQPVKWRMLIAGDSTEWMEVPRTPRKLPALLPWLVTISGLASLAGWWRWKLRQHQRRA